MDFSDLPEHVREALAARQAAHDREVMQVQDMNARLDNFIRTADRETLDIMRFMLQGASSDRKVASLYHGVIMAAMTIRYHLCAVCGGDHDVHPVEGMPDLVVKDGLMPPMTLGDLNRLDEETLEAQPFAQQGMEPSDMNFELYRLEWYSKDGSGDNLGLRCRDCGMPYVSLEDRMMKQPDECAGCYLKSANG